ncbi:PREDICTED: centromere protein O, partial [Buceros rhinoceros silvestris]|uniref:centromere protein O n=1 Tax=Buceros rhinoceros silvestris TaxID=175836 RepID=UPI0005287288
VFAHLEALEARAHTAAVEQEDTEQRVEKLARLRARVQELRLRRDELQAKVGLQQKGVRRGVWDAAEPRARAVLEWKIRSLKAMLQVSYLTGISAKLTRRGVCFCLSTAYEGTYLGSYYLDLLTKPQVRIHRHSIPVFIPLEHIAKQYLQTDIRRFLVVLFDHLNAYTGRRYQAEQLQERFADRIEGTVQSNSLCNLLVFKYNVLSKSETFPFSVRLLYSDLCSSLPTEVTISCAPEAPTSLAEAAAAHSDLFRRVALHKVFCFFSSAAGVP